MSSSMIKKILNFSKRRSSLEETKRKIKYPVVLETYGVLESSNPTVDTTYGTITYIYEDGTRKVYYKG